MFTFTCSYSERHGYYERQEMKYNNQVVYKQMFTGAVTNFIWFIGEKYNLWFVSSGISDQKSGTYFMFILFVGSVELTQLCGQV